MDGYIISVDAGGTKTKACAYSLIGALLCSQTAEFGNVSLDYDMAYIHIVKAVKNCIDLLGGKCIFVCVGAAGIETGDFKTRLKADLERSLRIPVYCTNDAQLALYSALEGKDGVLVVSGTGSIATCKYRGETSRVGGWGHLINDDGSGYWIGSQAIRRITDNYDSDNLNTPLEVAIFSHLKIASLRELVSYVYSHQKSDIAALLPVVEALAENGDRQSADILIAAGERLANLVFQICARHHLTKPRIAISGGVITKTRMTRMAFEQAIAAHYQKYQIVQTKNDPAKGGYYIWLEQPKQG
jgi:N-acetylglucosamine kinase-like BadF-type ATPase